MCLAVRSYVALLSPGRNVSLYRSALGSEEKGSDFSGAGRGLPAGAGDPGARDKSIPQRLGTPPQFCSAPPIHHPTFRAVRGVKFRRMTTRHRFAGGTTNDLGGLRPRRDRASSMRKVERDRRDRRMGLAGLGVLTGGRNTSRCKGRNEKKRGSDLLRSTREPEGLSITLQKRGRRSAQQSD